MKRKTRAALFFVLCMIIIFIPTITRYDSKEEAKEGYQVLYELETEDLYLFEYETEQNGRYLGFPYVITKKEENGRYTLLQGETKGARCIAVTSRDEYYYASFIQKENEYETIVIVRRQDGEYMENDFHIKDNENNHFTPIQSISGQNIIAYFCVVDYVVPNYTLYFQLDGEFVNLREYIEMMQSNGMLIK